MGHPAKGKSGQKPMKLAVLLSGGKDSLYSCWQAMKTDEVVCFITIQSQNTESYMFHTPNISLTRLQAEAADIPLIEWQTTGEKEAELDDLTQAIHFAVETYGVEGIVTGAIQSVYQAARVQRICAKQCLWCFNPIWLCNQEQYMHDLINTGFEAIIAGVFSAPFDETWLGKTIDQSFISCLLKIKDKYCISLTGEGGEYESFVCDAPFFSKKIHISSAKTDYHNHNGRYLIENAELVRK
jgi:ABC transporter with metal-binding/Fe-S-binding domain ATP-binding protein